MAVEKRRRGRRAARFPVLAHRVQDVRSHEASRDPRRFQKLVPRDLGNVLSDVGRARAEPGTLGLGLHAAPAPPPPRARREIEGIVLVAQEEDAPRLQEPARLGEEALEVAHVRDHAVGHDPVEAPGGELHRDPVAVLRFEVRHGGVHPLGEIPPDLRH